MSGFKNMDLNTWSANRKALKVKQNIEDGKLGFIINLDEKN